MRARSNECMAQQNDRPKKFGGFDQATIVWMSDVIERQDIKKPLSRLVDELGPLIAALKSMKFTWKQTVTLIEEISKSDEIVKLEIKPDELQRAYSRAKS